MKATNIKITILLFLVMACSPDHKPANKDLKDIQVLDSEATLAKVAQSKIDISEKELLTVSSNKSVEEEQALLEQADLGLYAAKDAGRDQVVALNL